MIRPRADRQTLSATIDAPEESLTHFCPASPSGHSYAANSQAAIHLCLSMRESRARCRQGQSARLLSSTNHRHPDRPVDARLGLLLRHCGGPWDWSRDLSEQVGWDEHADFMDSLLDDGFIVLGGPLAGDREILRVVCAASEEAVRERLARDNPVSRPAVSDFQRGRSGPEGVRWLPEFLRRLASEGRTVLVSSHVLAEVAQTVDRVLLISRGRLVLSSSLAELTARAGGAVRARSGDPQRLTTALRDEALLGDDGYRRRAARLGSVERPSGTNVAPPGSSPGISPESRTVFPRRSSASTRSSPLLR